MPAPDVLNELKTLGIDVVVEGDRLYLEPASQVPPELLATVREYKGEIINYLQHSEPRLVDAPPVWHAQEVARRVEVERVCIFWSEVLQEMIAFVAGESDLPLVPAGLVAFTPDEVEHIFPQGKDGLSPGSLRLIYEAKQLGDGKVIDVEWKADGC